MSRSCLFLRLLGVIVVSSGLGLLGACSAESESPPVSVSAPVASAPMQVADPAGQGLSIDRHADALLKEEAGSAAPIHATAGPAALPSQAPPPLAGTAQPSDTEGRLASLEQSVADLRAEFNAVLPAIHELVEAGRADRIAVASGTPTGAPEALTSSASAQPVSTPVFAPPAAPPVKTPVHETEAPPASAAAQPVKPPATALPVSTSASAASAQVTGVRVGIHPDRTRIVLDLSGPGTFQTDLDNTERLLLVDLPQTGWSASDSQTGAGKSLVIAWSSQSAHEGKGATAIFQLSGPAKILTSSALRPDGKAGHRIVIDLAPEGK